MNHRPSRYPTPTPRRPAAGRPTRRLTRIVRRLAPTVAVTTAAVLATGATPDAALAAASIEAVATNIRTWLVGILVAIATLFLTAGALRYLAANGDPGEIEKAKLALKSAAIGYALAMLAPLFMTILAAWVA
jgi:hypothetical protein